MSVRRAFFSAFLCTLCVWIAACEPTPTPLPVIIPPTNTPPSTGLPPIRIAVDPLYAAYVDSYGGFPIEAQTTLIDDAEVWNEIPEDLDGQYDAAFALGFAPTWSPSDIEIAWEIAFNANLAPLTQPEMIELLRQSFTGTAELSIIRSGFANAGYPDGVTLTMVQSAPATSFTAEVITAVRGLGIDLQVRAVENAEIDGYFADNRAHLALIARRMDATSANLVLRALPIYVQTAPEIEVTFTSEGIPIVSRN